MSKRNNDGDDPNLDSVQEKVVKKKPKTLTSYFSATTGKPIVVHSN